MRETAEPKYWPLRTWLEEFAAANPPGTPVPSERVLAERFELSRTSVRQAIREVTVAGLLRSVRGSGTFVAPPKTRYRMRLTSYSEEMRVQGVAVSGTLLVARVEPAGAAARFLAIGEADPVVRVERVRSADGVSMAIDESLFPAALVPGLDERVTAEGSVTELIEEHYGLRADRAEETVEAVMADAWSAAALGVETGLPLLLTTRQALLDDDRPLEWTRSFFRGDRAIIVAALAADG